MEYDIDKELEGEETDDLVPIWDSNLKEIHPALDFTDETAIVTQFLPFMNGEKEVLLPTIITSEGKLIPITEEKSKVNGFRISHIPNKIENRWSLDSIKKFINNTNYNYSIKEVFNDIKEEYERYIDFTDKRTYDFISLWVIGTYFHQIFNSYNYIFLNAVKRAGKTKVLTLTSELAFNAKFIQSLTTSTLFRLVQNNHCSLMIDETEKIHKRDQSDFRGLMLGGYKKGIKVPRARENKRDGGFTVDEYSVYSPRMMANIEGIEEVLEDRCINIVLQRTGNKEIANREVQIGDRILSNIRNNLYLCLMHNWKEVKERYGNVIDYFSVDSKIAQIGSNSKNSNDLVKNSVDSDEVKIKQDPPPVVDDKNSVDSVDKFNIDSGVDSVYNVDNNNIDNTPTSYNNNTLGGLVFTSPTSLSTLNLAKENMFSREFELWAPIITLASFVSEEVLIDILNFAIDSIKIRKEENVSETMDILITEILVRMVKSNDFYKVSDITKKLKESSEEEYKWLNSRWVSRALKRLGVVDEKKRLNSGIVIRMSIENVQKVGKNMGLDVESIVKEEREFEIEPTNNIDIVIKIISDMTDGTLKNASVSEVIEKALEKGIPESKTEKIINDMKNSGRLFEPKPNYLQLIK